MKHKLFFFLSAALMSFLFAVVGALALLGAFDAEVSFWSRDAVESVEGKIAWIAVSAVSLVVFSALAAREMRRGEGGSSGSASPHDRRRIGPGRESGGDP